MPCLIDTNVLVYSSVRESPFHDVARERLASLRAAGHELVVTRQVLREYVSVVTRPNVLAIPRSPGDAVEDARKFTSLFQVLPEAPTALELWLQLVADHAIIGPAVHDTYLVATALACGTTHLLTNNPRHFAPYQGLTVLPLVEHGVR
ncbi:MAG: PIN domain-containing protein [Deltaproteobacteria bacterium]|nr:PIN domain-containing protein [Deltaproteobacteria bacterium]